MPSTRDLAALRAPTLAEIEQLAAEAWARLPRQFRELAKDVVIQVHDFADDDILKEVGVESPYDLMGLYQGIALAHKSVADIARGPDYVFLYRAAILDYWIEDGDELGHLVTHVLVHEIGHHFGLSDADMANIEADAARRGD